MSQNEKVVKYQSKDGQEISLTFEVINKYLVRGNGTCTQQELIFFANLCKSRGLNPLTGDCYLIKYGERDPAAIITSIGFLRSRARANKNYRGHEKGVIVLDKDGNVKRTKGLVLPGETLVGGWAKALPWGDVVATEVEVNLEGYIKRTSKGEITKFWKKENQPTMIAKVAEGQCLKIAWPDEFSRMYTPEEIDTEPPETVIDITSEPVSNDESETTKVEFLSLIPDSVDKERLEQFLIKSAASFGDTVEQLRSRAINDFGAFMNTFTKWEKLNFPEKPDAPPSAEKEISSSPGIPDLLNESKWLRMKSGYATYIHSNKKTLLEFSNEYPSVIEKMKAKWLKQFAQDPWPLENNVNPVGENNSEVNTDVVENNEQQDNTDMFNIPEGTKPNVHISNLISDAATRVELEAILGDMNSMKANKLITDNDYAGLELMLSVRMDEFLIEKPF